MKRADDSIQAFPGPGQGDSFRLRRRIPRGGHGEEGHPISFYLGEGLTDGRSPCSDRIRQGPKVFRLLRPESPQRARDTCDALKNGLESALEVLEGSHEGDHLLHRIPFLDPVLQGDLDSRVRTEPPGFQLGFAAAGPDPHLIASRKDLQPRGLEGTRLRPFRRRGSSHEDPKRCDGPPPVAGPSRSPDHHAHPGPGSRRWRSGLELMVRWHR